MPPVASLHVGYLLEGLSPGAAASAVDELRALGRLGTRVTAFLLDHAEAAALVPGDVTVQVLRVPLGLGRFGSGHGRGRGSTPATWIAQRGTELGVQHWHAASAGVAAGVARRIHEITGLPYSLAVPSTDVPRVVAENDRLRAAIAASAFTTAPSETAIAQIVQQCGMFVARKLRCCPIGIDADRVAFTGAMDRLTDVVLAVGDQVESEGFLDLIDALAILRDRGRHTRLTLAGARMPETLLRARIESLHLGTRVTLATPLAPGQLVDLMKTHTLLAVPRLGGVEGRHAGAARLVLTAMASGLPVVSTDLPEVTAIISDGVTGRIVAQGQPLWLAGALETLLDAPAMRARFALAARREVESRFHLEHNVASLRHWFGHAAAGAVATAARRSLPQPRAGRPAIEGSA